MPHNIYYSIDLGIVKMLCRCAAFTSNRRQDGHLSQSGTGSFVPCGLRTQFLGKARATGIGQERSRGKGGRRGRAASSLLLCSPSTGANSLKGAAREAFAG